MFWCEYPRDVVQVVGPDAATYLQSQLSQDLRPLQVGESTWSFVLQPTGKVEVLLAHPASAGHGLNLQHGGCRMIWMSLPWSLELYEQAIGRLHRSGQAHDVWCYVLQTKGTVDEKILAALRDKRSLSDIALEALK